MGKTYIDSFIEYNYKSIAFDISAVNIDKLETKLKQDMINKMWRLRECVIDVGENIMFIENCDVEYNQILDEDYAEQYSIRDWYKEDGWIIHILKYDDGGFYYDND